MCQMAARVGREDIASARGNTGKVSDTATHCCCARDSRGVFTTANALTDQRLVEHAARAEVLAYCGVPVMNAEGQLLATLCHYDVVPRDPDQLDLPLLLCRWPALWRAAAMCRPTLPGSDGAPKGKRSRDRPARVHTDS